MRPDTTASAAPAEHCEQLRLAARVVGHLEPACRTRRSPTSMSSCGSITSKQASTSSGSSVVSWPVDVATSHPWISTSMNRCPQYTSPGTGPYDTAHGALHRARHAEDRRRDQRRSRRRRAAGRAEHVAVEPVADLFDGVPDAELGRPVVAGDDVVHQLAHGPVVAVGRAASHWSSPTPATERGASRRAPGRALREGRRPCAHLLVGLPRSTNAR